MSSRKNFAREYFERINATPKQRAKPAAKLLEEALKAACSNTPAGEKKARQFFRDVAERDLDVIKGVLVVLLQRVQSEL